MRLDFVSTEKECYHHEFGGNARKSFLEAEQFMLQFSLNKTQLAQTKALIGSRRRIHTWQ
jgi:hypothetical protein